MSERTAHKSGPIQERKAKDPASAFAAAPDPAPKTSRHHNTPDHAAQYLPGMSTHSDSASKPHALPDAAPRATSRRSILGVGLAAGAAAILPGTLSPRAHASQVTPPSAAAARRRSLRIVHMTDTHIQPEKGADKGVAACLSHIGSLPDKPDFIITGGDLIMEGFAVDEARVRLQWEVFTKTFASAPVPVFHTLGNHDIWGWNKGKSKTTGKERGWGKALATETLGLARPYNSFVRGDWRIITLDSVHVDPNDANGYLGKLDEAQLDWFTSELSAPTPAKHTLVVSHIPILTVTSILGGPRENTTVREVSGGIMHVDSPQLRTLMEKSNVRACLSGHTHRIDEVKHRGITYLCNGAVSGSWWNGPNAEAIEGYALLDLYDDGTVERTYTTYGWVPIKS